MEKSNITLFNVTEESLHLVENYFTKDDVELIRVGQLSAIGAIYDKTVDGVILYEIRDDQFVLIHGINVATNVDRAVMREKFIEWVAEKSQSMGLGVLCSFSCDEELERIFAGNGFVIKDSIAKDMTISFDDIKSLKYYASAKIPSAIVGAESLTKRIFNEFLLRQKDNHLFILAYRPNKLQKYVLKNDRIEGCILGSIREDGKCAIDYLYVTQANSVMAIPLLRSFIDEAAEKIGDSNFDITFAAANKSSVLLAEKLLEGKGKTGAWKTAVLTPI